MKPRNRYSPCQPDRQHAVALIVTLIMLAVITTLAIAFLALTRRETAAVDAMGRATDAELAADAGLERAKAEMLAPFLRRNLGTNNGTERMGPDFMVSMARDTNRLYTPQNPLANQVDPAAPVIVNTNRGSQAGPLDDRFYLDLNRNGEFEETGFVPLTDDQRRPIPNTITWTAGDPQWVGILQNPQFPHSSTNRFIARYAYAILPVGRGLDLNWIHNQAINQDPAQFQTVNGFYRNQGFGTYEINLAAFLADLNANAWCPFNANAISPGPSPYSFQPFNPVTAGIATGVAFDHARGLLAYRYDRNPLNLLSAQALMPMLGANFEADLLDSYANGPISALGEPLSRLPAPERDDTAFAPSGQPRPWPASDSARHFFTLHELFDVNKVNDFATWLQRASAQGDTYNRYTYYRLLSQLGTDSAEEDRGELNLNYVNVPSLVNTNDIVSAAEFIPWTTNSPAFVTRMGMSGPQLLFTHIADRLLTNDFFSVNTNIGLLQGREIPIFTNGSPNWIVRGLNNGPLYSSRIHQVLQLAANICDSTYSSKNAEAYPYYPSVFRPQFRVDNRGHVFIVGYSEVTRSDDGNSPIRLPWFQLGNLANGGARSLVEANVYGIPPIIGARKGLPSFNEVMVQTAAEYTRKLLFLKRDPFTTNIAETRVQLLMSISNNFGLEVWYPYTNSDVGPFRPTFGSYPRQLVFSYTNEMVTTLTNSDFPAQPYRTVSRTGWVTNITAGDLRAGQFFVPPIRVLDVLPPSVYYRTRTPMFQSLSNVLGDFETLTVGSNVWGITVTNYFSYFLVDKGEDNVDRIIDSVSLVADTYFDISRELTEGPAGNPIANAWSVRTVRGANEGILNQILVSLGDVNAGTDWRDFGGLNPATGQDKNKAVAGFRRFMGHPPLPQFPTNDLPPPTAEMQAPFTPTRKMYQTTTWQANDPLVHYRIEDLRSSTNQSDVITVRPATVIVPLTNSTYLGRVNSRYNPWGGRSASSSDTRDYESYEKDPGVFNPDFWDFPTNNFPNIGWLGRVHRGTPWQTIYLKSRVAPMGAWRAHTGGAFSTQTHPSNDWRLADLFTVAVHPNQTRGQLSVNQTNYAAWSAVLSGIQVSTVEEDSDGRLIRANAVLQPAAVDAPAFGLNAPLLAITDGTNGINAIRTNFPGWQFPRLGDVLAVPALTDESPFLTEPYLGANLASQRKTYRFPATDSDYERIPQQILSLLRAGESRFVVYSWGQSLKPAPPVTGLGPSILTSGPDRGLCRNYQVTGEMATRCVVRIEFDDELATDAMGNLVIVNGEPVRTGRKDYSRPHAVVESFNIIPVD